VASRKASFNRWAKPAGATLIALGLLIGLSLVPQQTAAPPQYLAKHLGQLFGAGTAIVPGLCLLVGLAFFVHERFRLSGRISGILVGYLSGLVLLHLRYPAGREFLAASGRKGGGFAGAGLAVALRWAIGEPGLWTVALLGAATSVLLLSGTSLTQVLRATILVVGRGGKAGAGAMLNAGVWLARVFVGGVRMRGPLLARGASRLMRDGWAAAVRLGGASTILRPRPLPQPASGPQAPAGPDLHPVGDGLWPAAPRGTPPVPTAGEALPPEAGRAADEPAAVIPVADPDRFSLPAAGSQGEIPEHARPDVERVTASDSAASQPDFSAGPPSRHKKPLAVQKTLAFPEERRAYTLPPLSLLDEFPPGRTRSGKVDPEEIARSLERTLSSFGVEAKVIRWETGPVVTRYELQPAPGVKVQRITSLQNDIALALAASSVRLEAPIPGKSAIGVELPNERPGLVHLREILTSEESRASSSPLTVAIGKGIAGRPIVGDIVSMPHVLIAGATGAGKSVAINCMIASILFRATPEQVRFLMIDPKRVELTNYNGIPHLLSPVVTAPREAAVKLRWAIQEMESRYETFAADGVRNIQAFNAQHPDRPLADILIIIDELADLMMVAPADFEEIICRLAQMTRATGIHLLIATQRPSVDVITGLIKANIPSRLAFAVTSQVDSRTILDHPGAEKLLGKGDMLFSPIGATRPTRVQGSFISDAETERLVEFWRAQGQPAYVEELVHGGEDRGADDAPADDALLMDAARLVVRAGYASVSLLQRKMRIGYVRAARLVDQLEERGIVGPPQGSSPRDVLAAQDDLDRILRPGALRPFDAEASGDEES